MDMQNVSNLVIPEGEVRTIHDKDSRLLWGRVSYNVKYSGDAAQDGTPTPDNLVPVQTVTGEQTVMVTGKNLFNGILEVGIINGNTGLDMPNNNYVRAKDYIPVEELSTYKISTTNSDITQILVYEYKADFSYNLSINKVVNTNSYLTTNSGTRYIRFRPSYLSTDTSMKFQVEKGTVATTYEPYQSQSYNVNLGSTEFCKIGNYQDYIYKSGDDWYVHKEIGKVTFTGAAEENWATGLSGNYRYFMIPFSDIVADRAKTVYSNNFKYYSGNEVNGVWGTNNGRIVIFSPESGGSLVASTISGFKTWLSTHNTTVYYILQTPTDTKITDATLIGQLDAIHQFLTRYGYNSNVSGNLPIIIDKTSLS